MHDDRFEPDTFHKNDVVTEILLQFDRVHGIATVLDDDCFALKLLDVGQAFNESFS